MFDKRWENLARQALGGDQAAEKDLWLAVSGYFHDYFTRYSRNGATPAVEEALAREALTRATVAFRIFDPLKDTFEMLVREAALLTNSDHYRAVRNEQLRAELGPERAEELIKEMESKLLPFDIREWLREHEPKEEDIHEMEIEIQKLRETGGVQIEDILREFEQMVEGQ